MNDQPIHTGVVKNGKVIWDMPELFKYDVEGFEDRYIEVKINEVKRADEFNRYYFAGVVKIFTDFFNKEKTFNKVIKKEFTHDLLTAKFLGYYDQVLPDGQIIKIRNGSRKLSKREFYDYVNYCKDWGTELFSLDFPEYKPEKNKQVISAIN